METGISIGSNMGDREKNLSIARTAIASISGTTVTAASSLYETEPVDVPGEYAHLPFLNAFILVNTDMAPPDFLNELQLIEKQMGRHRCARRNAPRIIDLDMIFAGREIINSGALTLPHPRWYDRRFVVEPLGEIRPDLILPGQTLTVKEILSGLSAHPTVVLFRKVW